MLMYENNVKHKHYYIVNIGIKESTVSIEQALLFIFHDRKVLAGHSGITVTTVCVCLFAF